MFKGWKHAVKCTKCQAITFIDEANYEVALDKALKMENEKSNCCKVNYEYIGLRPQNEHILNTPQFDEPETPMEFVETHRQVGDHSIDTIKAVPVVQQEAEEINEVLDNNTTEVSTDSTEIKLEDIYDTNRKMSGRYMTDIVRAVLEEDNDKTKAKLNVLKNEHPSFFQDSLKYVPKFLKTKYSLI